MTQEPKIFPYIERLLQGAEVVWKPLGEVCKVLRGKRLTKKELSDEGIYPVFHGGLIPLGYYNSYNRKGNQTMVINTGSIGEVVWSGVDFWSSDGTFVVETNDVIEDKFLYYYLKTKEQYLKSQKREGGVPTIDRSVVEKLSIPLPPLSVQQEIVRILDKFTQLEAELEAELDCRKRQYEYYRNKLLTFNEIGGGTEIVWKTLGEVGTFIRGNGLQKKDLITSGVPAIHYGQIYTYYGISAEQTISFVSPETAEGLRKVDYGDVIITNTSENIDDVGKAVAYCVKEQGVTGGHATIFKPSEKIIGKYLVYYTQTTEFSNQKRKYAKGTKVIDISANDLTKITIPLPPLSKQQRIANILDKFDTLVNSISEGLPKEIALRRKQYEYYREKLLSFPS
ncbi:restriction endonuclease subunit S [uncultured Capnocytophaga sp.]|uniref:restriction endonuclease subunit S n=1 Tax=uncultured Capnocytophaga sp. TaxID=159273 RepID=UPI0025981D8A|nr:restriction endonuclease subunit S [uncultured Capnocytophaga sp.]